MDTNQFVLLEAKLDDLISGRCQAIEYGDGRHQGGYYSLLRIRWISTMAGNQYSVKLLHRGMEGSGEYFLPGDRVQLKARLAYHIGQYEKPIQNPKLRKLLADRRAQWGPPPTLSFFEVI